MYGFIIYVCGCGFVFANVTRRRISILGFQSTVLVDSCDLFIHPVDMILWSFCICEAVH